MGGGTEAYRWRVVTARIIVQPEAEADLVEAFGWYEQRHSGLGHEFLDEIDRVFARIAEHPFSAAQIWREARRALPRRFPYAVLYVTRGESVYVLAVLHQRRDPNLTRARVGGFPAG